jgi:hypothetical protein
VFAAEIIAALAWSRALLFSVLMPRKPLEELIRLLRELRYKEMEHELSEQVLELT